MIKRIKVIAVLSLLGFCILLVKKAFSCNISSMEDFRQFMQGYGVFGPVVLTLIQALQVVIPVLPGYLGCAVGAMSYGTAIGFICNYIGICAGSVVAFFLAEKYGKKLLVDLFSEKTCQKWIGIAQGRKSYSVFLFAATVLPFFPDDFLCYFSGLIRMKRKRFVWIILLGKPWCILAYSIIFGIVK